ncbi:MAG TPA: N-acetylneuraminate synthase family protein [Gemmatimonadaceae bacterium]|nr:N-acetylneuraminate synthase family protein [Gemmatimonadaceae bacterium]
MTSRERHITIGGRRIGPNEPCYVIAEIGVNHNGDLALAKHLVDAAVAAGADAVKFQKRKLNETYRREILDQPRHGEQGLQYLVPLLVEFELSDDAFRELHAYCTARDITFMCTPWDRASVDFLETMRLDGYKIGSPDMTNFPLIEYVAATGKPLLVSTGMSTEDEIRRTLAYLESLHAEYALFHCVSTYPAAPEEINLRFMLTLREWSGRPVGYSGHDVGTTISLAAVAMGARLLERHITLDRGMRGPDHKASLEPAQFAEQVRAVREVEMSLGAPNRWMTRGETLNRRALAKSLVAATAIPAGTPITREMVVSKSPGLGLSPQFVDQLVGRALRRTVAADEMFLPQDIVDARATPRETRPIDTGAAWGVVARFLDLAPLEARFAPLGMRFIEFHVSDRDLDAGAAGYTAGDKPYGLVVHAPEYAHETLIDLCAADDAQRALSVARIQKTIDLTRAIAPHFRLDPALFPRGPKIVMHVGGMSQKPGGYDVQAATRRLLAALRELDTAGVDLLLENLPPHPWYFGGRWFGHIICDPDNTVRLCEASGLGLCFDTSHAALECARSGASLVEFAARVALFVRHLHVSDGAGTSGEGLQIGEGNVNFVDVLPPLLATGCTMIPEIWMGHHEVGEGFRVALEHLTDIHWAGDALRRPADRRARADLAALTVADSATVFAALRAIDANRMGIVFVVDADRRVVGVLTDGDVRHAFVRGFGLHSPVADVMTREFAAGTVGMSRAELEAKLPGRTRVMPILDADRRLADYASGTHLPGTRA